MAFTLTVNGHPDFNPSSHDTAIGVYSENDWSAWDYQLDPAGSTYTFSSDTITDGYPIAIVVKTPGFLPLIVEWDGTYDLTLDYAPSAWTSFMGDGYRGAGSYDPTLLQVTYAPSSNILVEIGNGAVDALSIASAVEEASNTTSALAWYANRLGRTFRRGMPFEVWQGGLSGVGRFIGSVFAAGPDITLARWHAGDDDARVLGYLLPTFDNNVSSYNGSVQYQLFGGSTIETIMKLLRNKVVTDPAAGTYTLYADDDTTVLLQGDIYEDAAGITAYGSASTKINRRNRLT